MSAITKYSRNQYFSGGLAEIVSSPTPLTYSFLKEWFTGNGSLGKAMHLLHMPYNKTSLPVLERIDNELVINLTNEEKTLYEQTIFTYHAQKDIHDVPKLTAAIRKLFHPLYLFKTGEILMNQSQWIANPHSALTLAEQLVSTIPECISTDGIEKIDTVLKNDVWPQVVAIGLLSEFYNQFVMKEAKEKSTDVQMYISREIAQKDWFFLSIADQTLVKEGKLSFVEYMKLYGLRADKDYELTCPRWHEIPETIEKRIQHSASTTTPASQVSVPNKLIKFITVSIALQLLRSEAKKKALLHIDALRKSILQKTTTLSDISHVTKDDIIHGTIPSLVQQTQNTTSLQTSTVVSSGKGIPVSQGLVTGIAQHISTHDIDIPKGTIGIFPNASPEFAIEFPKCTGMIFIKGGQTSHGAIVAREFHIPAIIDKSAAGIEDGITISLNATTGAWHTI